MIRGMRCAEDDGRGLCVVSLERIIQLVGRAMAIVRGTTEARSRSGQLKRTRMRFPRGAVSISTARKTVGGDRAARGRCGDRRC